MNYLSKSLLVIALSFLQACSSGMVKPTEVASADNVGTNAAAVSRRVELGRVVDEPLALIARDMVNMLSQVLWSSGAEGTNVKFNSIETEFDKAVRNALVLQGHSILNVAAGTSDVISSSVIPLSDKESGMQTHVLSLGGITLRRLYSVRANKVAPASSLYVAGASASDFRLDDRIFLPNNYPLKSNADQLYLCTPETKGLDEDGWVCAEGKNGKQWVNRSTHEALVDIGVPVRPLSWVDLNDRSEVIILNPKKRSLPRQSGQTLLGLNRAS